MYVVRQNFRGFNLEVWDRLSMDIPLRRGIANQREDKREKKTQVPLKHFGAWRKQSHGDPPSGLISANPSITCIDRSLPHHLHHYLAVNASYSFAIDLVSSFLDGQHPWYTSPSVNILLAYLLRSVSNSHPLMPDSTNCYSKWKEICIHSVETKFCVTMCMG